jgi:olfactory receptor
LFDISFVSTTVPKMIVNIQIQTRAIFYVGYLTRMYFFVLFGCVDEKLLTVMAYDLFLTICHLLSYPVIMSPHLCVSLFCYLFWVVFRIASACFDCTTDNKVQRSGNF